jgi:hypothetical protein
MGNPCGSNDTIQRVGAPTGGESFPRLAQRGRQAMMSNASAVGGGRAGVRTGLAVGKRGIPTRLGGENDV